MISPILAIDLARLAELEACEARASEPARAEYLNTEADRLRDNMKARAVARLVPHLRAGGLVRISFGHFCDTIGPRADATSLVARFSTVAYDPDTPSGDERVYDRAEDAAAAYVRTVGALAVLDYLEPPDEPDEDHRGEERAERERERADRGW